MVFPLYDENPLDWPRPPYVTWALIGINVVVFLAMTGATDAQQIAIVKSYGLVPNQLTDPYVYGARPMLTLLTNMFLHGGWDHILGNMIYLWVFGDDIEEALGPVRFLILYVLSGIVGALAFALLNPASATPLVGASGAIAGVLAAYLMLRPCAKVSVFILRGVVRIQALWAIGGWVVLQFLLFASKPDDDVAYLAHFGGLAAGALLFFGLRPAGVKLFECMDGVDLPFGDD